MGYSEIVYSSIGMPDIMVPNKPVVLLARVGSREIEVRVTLPILDADGGILTGMTELILAVLPEVTFGDNPFSGISGANLATHAENNGGQSNITFLVEGDAGQLKIARFPNLVIGKVYWVAVVVKDAS